MAPEIRKKLIWEAGSLAVFLVIIGLLYPILTKSAARRSARAYWTEEDEMQRRRLFGEAWKDV
jgi:hypothetical protein